MLRYALATLLLVTISNGCSKSCNCEPEASTPVTLSGVVVGANGIGIPDVPVMISGNWGSRVDTTLGDGSYAFLEQPIDREYEVEALVDDLGPTYPGQIAMPGSYTVRQPTDSRLDLDFVVFDEPHVTVTIEIRRANGNLYIANTGEAVGGVQYGSFATPMPTGTTEVDVQTGANLLILGVSPAAIQPSQVSLTNIQQSTTVTFTVN